MSLVFRLFAPAVPGSLHLTVSRAGPASGSTDAQDG